MFLIKKTDDKTGDEMTTEAEPAGLNAGPNFVGTFSYKFGPDRGWVPSDIPVEELKKIIALKLLEATQDFNHSGSQREVFIRVKPGGTHFSIHDFHRQIAIGINMIRSCAEKLHLSKYPTTPLPSAAL